MAISMTISTTKSGSEWARSIMLDSEATISVSSTDTISPIQAEWLADNLQSYIGILLAKGMPTEEEIKANKNKRSFKPVNAAKRYSASGNALPLAQLVDLNTIILRMLDTTDKFTRIIEHLPQATPKKPVVCIPNDIQPYHPIKSRRIEKETWFSPDDWKKLDEMLGDTDRRGQFKTLITWLKDCTKVYTNHAYKDSLAFCIAKQQLARILEHEGVHDILTTPKTCTGASAAYHDLSVRVAV